MQKLIYFLLLLVVSFPFSSLHAKGIILADESTRSSLPYASVFDGEGKLIGVSDAKGFLPFISQKDYPITIKYLGYEDCILESIKSDTVFMTDFPLELSELIIESKKYSHLHLLAYVREFSTLSTLNDTVTLFREKMVDFMTPIVNKSKIKGWRTPRVLTSKSFYRFTNDIGLDSVSDRCTYHFSWTDWMGLIPAAKLPKRLHNIETGSDTIFGKYSMTELWQRDQDFVTLDIDVLADTSSRKWVSNLSLFFQKETDFEYFKAKYRFNPISDNTINESSLTGFSFNIESKGRGREMFMFNRRNDPVYVSTYCEVFILDREYITTKEASKWQNLNIVGEDIALLVPQEAPPLQPSIQKLIERVNNLNHEEVRLSIRPDLSNIGYKPQSVSIGHHVLQRLKGMFGIDQVIANKKWNKNYNDFKHNQRARNQQ